jgi:hypothetical protein
MKRHPTLPLTRQCGNAAPRKMSTR